MLLWFMYQSVYVGSSSKTKPCAILKCSTQYKSLDLMINWETYQYYKSPYKFDFSLGLNSIEKEPYCS